MVRVKPFALGMCIGLSIAGSPWGADGKWDLFLLFGQSNMAGAAQAEAQDMTANPRIKVLAYNNCVSRTYNQWYNATPPLHECGKGLGPGDYFSKTLLDTAGKVGLSLDTIGLIPCAISGVDISFFSKNVVSSRRKEFSIPPDNKWDGAYPWMLSRIKEAQKKGQIRGIIFHQGESDWTDTARKVWVSRVQAIYNNLKADAGFGDVPFVAGELRRDGCCSAHNPYVAQLAKALPYGAVASSEGLAGLGDNYHFNAASYRTFGHRYAAAMVQLLKKMPASVDGALPPSLARLKVQETRGGLVVRSEVALDRVELVSPRGDIFELGKGREVRVEGARFRPGVYFLRAHVGHDVEQRSVLIHS